MPQSEAATSASGDPTQGSSPSPTSKTLIACALAVERGTVIPVIRDALDELLGRERERHKSELVGATRGLAIAKLEAGRGRAGAGTGHQARQGSRSAEPVEAREVSGMSALARGAENLCSMTVLRLMIHTSRFAGRNIRRQWLV